MKAIRFVLFSCVGLRVSLFVCLALSMFMASSCTAYQRDFEDYERPSFASLEETRELLSDHIKIDRSAPAYYLSISSEEIDRLGINRDYLPLIREELARLNRAVSEAAERGAVLVLTTKNDSYISPVQQEELISISEEPVDGLRGMQYDREVSYSTAGRMDKVRFASPQTHVKVSVNTFSNRGPGGPDYWNLYIHSGSAKWSGRKGIALSGTYSMHKHSYWWRHDGADKKLGSYDWDFSVTMHAGLNSGVRVWIED